MVHILRIRMDLVPGRVYRGQSRTWCDPNGGAYKADHGLHLYSGLNQLLLDLREVVQLLT